MTVALAMLFVRSATPMDYYQDYRHETNGLLNDAEGFERMGQP